MSEAFIIYFVAQDLINNSRSTCFYTRILNVFENTKLYNRKLYMNKYPEDMKIKLLEDYI